jgi:hypothetical protein
MYKLTQYFLSLPLLFIVSCSADNIFFPVDDPNKAYPTTLHVLSQTVLDSLKIIFKQKIGSTYIAKLDSFGLIGDTTLWNRDTSSISEPQEAVSLAKAALVLLKDFSNVSDTSLLSAGSVHKLSGSRINDWSIWFQTQRINGMEVYGTSLNVLVADKYICLSGHFYKDIFIPSKNSISKIHAKNILVGRVIDYECWGPSTFRITDSTINVDSLKLCVYPLHKGDTIELRVAWQVPISYSLESHAMWYYFIDVMTGEIIGSMDLFIC